MRTRTGALTPAAVDVVDLVVFVERHSLHAVRQWAVQHSDTCTRKHNERTSNL